MAKPIELTHSGDSVENLNFKYRQVALPDVGGTSSGFTLVELITVLLILGILAAVAAPKYFDLQTKAHENVVYGAVSELKVRVNQYFAYSLLRGYTWSQIWVTTSVAPAPNIGDIGTDLGDNFSITRFQLSGIPPSQTAGYISIEGNYWTDSTKTKGVLLQDFTPTIELPKNIN